MKYIIMAGGDYQQWETPRQLLEIKGEPIIARTIRLLREHGIDDIAISSNNDAFEQFGVPMLRHTNDLVVRGHNDLDGSWLSAFYPTDEPACYLFGDVVYSPEAIRTIVETETNDIEFFASAPPYSVDYVKPWPEPFAFKVVDTNHLRQAVKDCKDYARWGYFWREPIAWELWAVIKQGKLKRRPDVYAINYTVINDYTCDVDGKHDLEAIENHIK